AVQLDEAITIRSRVTEVGRLQGNDAERITPLTRAVVEARQHVTVAGARKDAIRVTGEVRLTQTFRAGIGRLREGVLVTKSTASLTQEVGLEAGHRAGVVAAAADMDQWVRARRNVGASLILQGGDRQRCALPDATHDLRGDARRAVRCIGRQRAV